MADGFHTFRAPTLDEAYAQMRKVLGPDAIVVRTTHVRDGGLWGFLGRSLVQLTVSAPVTLPRSARPRTAPERHYLSQADHAPGSEGRASETVAYFQKLVTDAQHRIRSRPVHGPALPQHGNAAVAPALDEAATPELDRARPFERDVCEIRRMLDVLVAETPGAGLPTDIAPHYRRLVASGMSRSAAAEIAASSSGQTTADSLLCLKRSVRDRLRATGGIRIEAGHTRKVALVGPTGVGKTTTLAKLAARFALREGARVALITADTYRIAAPEQLRVYASIIGLPMHVANDAAEMRASLERCKGYDLVLVDTAGSSPFNGQQTNELREILECADLDEAMLVVAANTPLEDLRETASKFALMRPSSLLFTKLDETRRYGALYSLAVESGLPLSYLSNGQNVPDDLLLAQPDAVANLIVEVQQNRG